MSNDKNTSNIVDFPVLEPSELIITDGNTLKTTSLNVADTFNKRHDNLLTKVEKLDCSPEFSALNFKVCYENNELQNGKPQKYYEMTKDGFVFLVMSFTGKKAAQIKEAYINAFNWMADKLLGQNEKLSSAHQREIQKEVSKRVYEHPEDSRARLYKLVWGRVKDHFKVGQYKDVPESRFDELMHYVQSMEIETPSIECKSKSVIPMDGRFFVKFQDGQAHFTPVSDDMIIASLNDLPEAIRDTVIVSNDNLERIANICTARLAMRAEKARPN